MVPVFLYDVQLNLTYEGDVVISESAKGSGPLAEGHSREAASVFKVLLMSLFLFHEPC